MYRRVVMYLFQYVILLSLFVCIQSNLFSSTIGIFNLLKYFNKPTADPIVSVPVPGNITNSTSTQKINEHMIVTFVNGIYHSEKDVENIVNYLRSTFNTEVQPFYNPTSGSWVMDAYKAGFGLVLRPNDLVLAKKLADHLRNALKSVRPNGGRVLHIAHSGGAILTYLAAKYHLSFAESSRIDVITLGGGRSLTHKYFKGRVYNYYSRNDPVLLVENRATQLMRKTKNNTYAVIQDMKHNTTFVFLEAIAKDPIFDHAMEGPTYRKALQWEALQYQQRLQQLILLEKKEKDYIRIIRKKTANITGIHHFWKRYTPDSLFDSPRIFRKIAAKYTQNHGVFSGKYRILSEMKQDIITEEKLLNASVLTNDHPLNLTVKSTPMVVDIVIPTGLNTSALVNNNNSIIAIMNNTNTIDINNSSTAENATNLQPLYALPGVSTVEQGSGGSSSSSSSSSSSVDNNTAIAVSTINDTEAVAAALALQAVIDWLQCIETR